MTCSFLPGLWATIVTKCGWWQRTRWDLNNKGLWLWRTANIGFRCFWNRTILLSVLYRWTISKSHRKGNRASIKLISWSDVTDERTNLWAFPAAAAILIQFYCLCVIYLCQLFTLNKSSILRRVRVQIKSCFATVDDTFKSAANSCNDDRWF